MATPQPTTTVLQDYRHARKIFVDDHFRLSPKYGFLFYVEFEFNPEISLVTTTTQQELGMIVQRVQLPKYTLDVKTFNAYNRVNLVQNKIKYDPVVITFHDDQSDNVRNFWYDYYSYFYRDSDYADVTYAAPGKYQRRPSFDWGYSPRPAYEFDNANKWQPYQYIKSIRIYSLYQKQFSEYQLINPVITAFKHGEHNTSDNTGLMNHEMTVSYEAVKYLTGYVTKNNVAGFVDLHYDQRPSPLTGQAGTDVAILPDGTLGPAPDTITDLAFPGRVFGYEQAAPATIGATFLPITFGSTYNASTLLSQAFGINNAGFAIPSLGTLTGGLTNSQIIEQQVKAGAINIAQSVATSAANGLIGGLASGLGPNGGAVLGLIAQGIANPKALAATAVNMATTYAMQQIGSAISNFTNPLFESASKEISGFVNNNITEPLTKAWGDVTGGIKDSINGWSDVGGLKVLDADLQSTLNTPEIFEIPEFPSVDVGGGWPPIP